MFIVEGDEVTRISQKTYDAFYSQNEAVLPEYAGRTIMVAVVLDALENRKPKHIVKIDTQRVRVRPDGSIEQGHLSETLHLAVRRIETDYPVSPELEVAAPGVVDATAMFDERRWKQLHPELRGPALKGILNALFGS